MRKFLGYTGLRARPDHRFDKRIDLFLRVVGYRGLSNARAFYERFDFSRFLTQYDGSGVPMMFPLRSYDANHTS